MVHYTHLTKIKAHHTHPQAYYAKYKFELKKRKKKRDDHEEKEEKLA